MGAATIAGSFFVIIASIPVLINGVFGFQNKEVAAKVSGGFGVGCSVPGVIGAGICTIVLRHQKRRETKLNLRIIMGQQDIHFLVFVSFFGLCVSFFDLVVCFSKISNIHMMIM